MSSNLPTDNDLKVDICVIGAGSGGLSVTAGAAQMGAKTVLIEKGTMGGDCLNTGCVPSKALLAAAHAADRIRRADRFGISNGEPAIDFAAVRRHVEGTIAAIAPEDSVERFQGLGVNVIQAPARFSGPGTVEAGGNRISARRFVIATGSQPMVPPIPGLDGVPYLTNETIFGLEDLPEHLIIIGGGPIGIEMAQAFRHLGARVTVLEMFTLLPKDDPELVAVLRARLEADGISLVEGVSVTSVARTANGVDVALKKEGVEQRLQGSHLLLAAGRRASTEGLDLEKAGVEYQDGGIPVDSRMRTSNRKIFAIGDVVAGGYQFTHVAGYQAGVVLRNALFRLPARADRRAVPWVTYTSPELAQTGLTEGQARAKGIKFRVLRSSLADNHRARAEGIADGLIKVVVSPRGRVLGAGIVGPGAGDLIQTWVLAMDRKINIGCIAGMIVPYPTLGEINKRAAGEFFTAALFGERTKKIVRFLRLFG